MPSPGARGSARRRVIAAIRLFVTIRAATISWRRGAFFDYRSLTMSRALQSTGKTHHWRPARTVSFGSAIAVTAGILAFCAPRSRAAEAPAGAFDWGFTLRLRQEYIRNAFDFSDDRMDDRNCLRARSQLWASWTPSAVWKAYAMLNNEHRHWYKSATGLEHQEFEIDEVVVENLYLEGTRIGGTPFGFSIGRQNLFWGEGFVVWDGDPLDGSRTAYFNAAVLTATFGARRLAAHFISNPRQDRYLPVWNDQDRSLIEWNERGAGLSYTDVSREGRTLEAYYLYKRESGGSLRAGPNDVHTAGARWSGPALGKLVVRAEAAGQHGTGSGDAQGDRFGFGGYLRGACPLPTGRIPLRFSAGAIYLSGDTRGSRAWTPVYSRWPKWSELYIYTLGAETRVADWTNLIAAHAGLGLELGARLAFEASVYDMYAPERPPMGASAPLGSGTHRGTLSVMRLDWVLEKHVSGHLLWEAFSPGSYYAAGDAAHFLRWEALFKF